MDSLYFLDPFSVAVNGFDTFDIYSNALSIASLGFIKLKVTEIVIKRHGGGDQGYAPAPGPDGVQPKINLWKELEDKEPVPDLDKVKEIFKKVNATEVEITLEPINGAIIQLEEIKPHYEKMFPEFKIGVEYIQQDNKKPKFSIILEKIDNI